jgi:hypothetical protein
MKTTVALFFALVILLPHSANATTLTITVGRAVLTQPVSYGGENTILFAGSGFEVYQSREPTFFGDLSRAFGVEPFLQPILFYSSRFSGLVDVQVGTQHCGMIDFVSCGDITLTSPGFAMPTDWPINTPFVATVPFTATGQLLVGGNQYDLVGHGTVTGTRCLTPCGPFSETRAILNYRFSVGEPPSLVLMLVSTIAIGIVFLVHRRSDVNI